MGDGTFLDFQICSQQTKYMRTSNATFFFLPALLLIIYLAISTESGRERSLQKETPENARELLRTTDKSNRKIGQHAGVKIYGWSEASVSLKLGGNTSESTWEFRVHSDI